MKCSVKYQNAQPIHINFAMKSSLKTEKENEDLSANQKLMKSLTQPINGSMSIKVFVKTNLVNHEKRRT